ncbi:MAG: radical SAM protein [Burkholderiaceae bacterium]|nr:radical SAM protein [Burkholderiaceae bacterium]
MKLLLINPRFPESFWSLRWAVDQALPSQRAVNPPLGLATLAALCPDHWEVSIVDENVESVPLAPEADLIGVCGMGVQFERQRELIEHFRQAGYYVVAGGSFASLCPERYRDLACTVVAGEAEYVWPRFCADFERGQPAALYQETGVVRLEDSPTPRFDLLKLDRYAVATIQFSRGCPFLCEFCDIIVMFGRKPRHKSLAQIERELDALRALGARSVFFVDDNLIGNKAVARELASSLFAYQKRHGFPLRFGTEASINLAQEPELLELFRAAKFTWVFIGIESPDPETLKQARKSQNTREDLLVSLRRIYQYGIDVLAGFIVGFDNDTLQTFEHQYRFIVEAGIQVSMVGLLTALPKTPLHARLKAEGRLRDLDSADNTKAATNVIPKRMSYHELVEGYQRMMRRLSADSAIAQRVLNKLRWMRQPVYDGGYSPAQSLGIIGRLLWRGVARGGPSRIWHFARTVPWTAPRKLPLVISEWILGLAMQDYVIRHFRPESESLRHRRRAARRLQKIQRLAALSLSGVRVALSHASSLPHVSISLPGASCRSFLDAAGRHLEQLLRATQSSLTLRIDAVLESEREEVQRLLARLARYGDRVFVVLGDNARGLLHVDSSVFRLRLGRSAA